MEGILEWVKQIACYMVLVTVLADLLPKKNYEKYFRLFAGLVLVLLVIQPVTGSLKLDTRLSNMFQEIQYEGMAEEFRQRASEMEEKRYQQITDGYAGLIEEDIEAMAQEEGISGVEASVTIEKNPEKEDYGRLQAVRITVWNQEETREAAASVPGEEIKVGEIRMEGPEGWYEDGEEDATGTAAADLRSRVADEYGLEEDHVEIRRKD